MHVANRMSQATISAPQSVLMEGRTMMTLRGDVKFDVGSQTFYGV